MENKKKVFIVDDSTENIRVLVEILKNNYTISIAKDGKKAVEMIEDDLNPDLILLDIFMPEVDGFEVAKRVKSNSKYQDIPIIFNTSADDLESIQKGFELGAADYITKPYNPIELQSRVKTHIGLYKNLKRKLDENKTLLEQYKRIVDESDIISKTDPKGKITYVNKKFEQTSGYTKEELIGKHHNIVRHEDMPSSAFRDLWKTVKNKQVWRGEVKNRHKDGSFYIVDSTVMPIFDVHGEIKEYISVRHDVTNIHKLNEEIEGAQKEVIFTLGSIGESRSRETGNHVRRVAEYSYLFAKIFGLDEKEAKLLKDASPMHDIGKVAIPDSILNKPGKLTIEEFEVMKSHAKIGYEMLNHSDRPLMKAAATIALEHHERWDGNGYPNHLEGEDIHIYGRITALADVFDALGSQRCYKDAWELDRILDYLKEESGKYFDPKLVDIFLDNIDQFLEIRETYKDEFNS